MNTNATMTMTISSQKPIFISNVSFPVPRAFPRPTAPEEYVDPLDYDPEGYTSKQAGAGIASGPSNQVKSLMERDENVWIKQLKAWMLQKGRALTKAKKRVYQNESVEKVALIRYFENIIQFTVDLSETNELTKDIWYLERLPIIITRNILLFTNRSSATTLTVPLRTFTQMII